MTKEKTITTVVIKARYNAGQIPPLTPEMELLGLLFDWKMLGGPIGLGLQWNTLDEYLSDKSGPRLKDWHIVEDENFHFYRKILPDDQISIVTSKHSRNLSPKKLDAIQNAMHNMMPLLYSSELRQLCIEGEKNTNGKLTEWCPRPLYEKWQNYVFDNLIEAHTDRLLEKIAIEINSSILNNVCTIQTIKKLFENYGIDISEQIITQIYNLPQPNSEPVEDATSYKEALKELEERRQGANSNGNEQIKEIQMEEHHALDFYMGLLESKGFGKEIDYKKAIIEILRKQEVEFQLKVIGSVVSELSDIFNREAIVVDGETLDLLVNLTIMFNYDFENRSAHTYAVQELKTLHKIMYLMSAKTLTLANPQYPQTDNHTRECKAELHFEKPDYKQILKEFNELERNDNNLSKEFEKINLWVKEKEKIFLYNYDFTQNGFIEYISQKSKCAIKYPIIDFIIDKILRLIKTVYTRSEFGMPDFLSAGEYYISVCHYCGGIFYRKRPNARFCDYYVFNANSGEEEDSLRGCAKAAVDDKRSRK